MRFVRLCSQLLLVASLACDGDAKDKTDDAKADDGKTDEVEAGADAKAEGAGATKTDDAAAGAADAPPTDDDKSKDRGEASAMLGDKPFVAETARAKLVDGKLTLTFSRMDTIDGKMQREAFTFSIKDYGGPGEYVIDNMSSNYSGVGFDLERAKQAVDADGKTDDAKVTAQAVDTIKKSEIILLQGAKVTITSASEDEYVGTFAWKPQGAFSNKPPIEDGKFRATVRARK